MRRRRAALGSVILVVCVINGLACGHRVANSLSDRCLLDKSLDYESIESALQYSPNEFNVYEGEVFYVGNRVDLIPKSNFKNNVALSGAVCLGGDETRRFQYHVVMVSEKMVTGSFFGANGLKVNKDLAFISVLILATCSGKDTMFALFTLTRFDDRWRVEGSAIKLYTELPTYRDVDAFLLDQDTPDYQLVPRSSIEDASNADLYDTHVEFYSVQICRTVCEELFRGVPRSFVDYL